jgi:ribosomal protein L13E
MMEVAEAQRVRSLEDENLRLKQLVADVSPDKEALKAIVRKNGWSGLKSGRGLCRETVRHLRAPGLHAREARSQQLSL